MVLSLALALQSIGTEPNASEPPPNIVFVMADDLGYGELGCYGQTKIRTPHIDRLADEGVRMTRFYSSSPVCAPTRCSLLTGRHQGHASIRGNKEQGSGPMGVEGQFPLSPRDQTTAEILKARGYRTGLFGKWGLGGSAPGQNPLDHGFDRFHGYLCQRRAHTHYPTYLWNGYNVEPQPGNLVFNPHQKIDKPLESEDEYYRLFGGERYAPEAALREALAFITENKDRPFYLNFASTLPHLALQAPKEWVDRYPKEWDAEPYLGGGGYLPCARPRATYAAMVSYFDHSVGELVKLVDSLGLGRRTVFIVTGDNGTTMADGVDRRFFDSLGGLRGTKMTLYEGGIRVPFVARWTGRFTAGAVSSQVATLTDMNATLFDLLGGGKADGDGVSFAAALTTGSQTIRSATYFEYPEAGGWQAVLLRDRHKGVRRQTSKQIRLELYDLDTDPLEQNDIAASNPKIVAEIERIMSKEHTPNADFPLPGIDR